MKYIKNFEVFESVIMPSKIDDNSQVRSFEDAVKFGEKHDFDVVGYDDFYNSLGEGDKKTAPPRVGVPFFALFHPIRKKAMFVISDTNAPRFIPGFKDIMLDIIGHERIHAEQSRRKGDIEYRLPSPLDKKSYFSNKEEVMAFSFTIANELHKQSKDMETALDKLQKGGYRGQSAQLWSEIKKSCDEKTLKRYMKYIYLYLDRMFNGEKVEEAKSSTYKGRKIPGKYLTKNPGKMKREIDRFRGKKEYKKDWDADYTSGKGGVGKRVKTKKSAATKAYEKRFGKKKDK